MQIFFSFLCINYNLLMEAECPKPILDIDTNSICSQMEETLPFGQWEKSIDLLRQRYVVIYLFTKKNPKSRESVNSPTLMWQGLRMSVWIYLKSEQKLYILGDNFLKFYISYDRDNERGIIGIKVLRMGGNHRVKEWESSRILSCLCWLWVE